MSLPAIFTSVEGRLGSGHFAEAARLLQPIQRLRSDAELVAFRLLDSELAIELGNTSEALRHAISVVKQSTAAPLLRARAHRVLARSYYHLGELEKSAEQLNHAAALSRQESDTRQLAQVELTR